jgi:pyruvate,orthophosphate dikinase
MDSYRRLLQMFGGPCSASRRALLRALDAAKDAKGVTDDLDLDVDDLTALVETFKTIIKEHAGIDFPQDPREQMDLAIRPSSSRGTPTCRPLPPPGAHPRRPRHGRQHQAMVFGNRGMTSGSGVASPVTRVRRQGSYGDYLQNAQGEDVVAGIRNTVSLADMKEIDQSSHDELSRSWPPSSGTTATCATSSSPSSSGKLWMLQTRVGKRTPEAAFRIAVHMVDEGLIDMDEALRRVSGEQLANLMFPRFDAKARKDLLAVGMNASPGAAVGKAVFDWATAVDWSEQGEDVILVRKETTPDDLHGMMVAKGVLTSRGGKTSHAAVVARGMGRTCVCGAESLDVDTREGEFRVRGGKTIVEGDIISIDGSTGEVFDGEGAGRRLPRGAPLRGHGGGPAGGRGSRPADGARRLDPPDARAHQCGHGRGRRTGPAFRGRGHRVVPDRAHVPRRAPPAGREPHRCRG